MSAGADNWFSSGGRTLRGSGDIVEEVRPVDEFSRIRLACSADISVRIGETRSLKVIADDNLMEYVITEVADRGTLFVDFDRSISSRQGILLEITVPDLAGIEVDGSGDFEIEGLNGDRFEVNVDGSGDVDVFGTAKIVEIFLDGSGDITFEGLAAESLELRSRGSGDIRLRGDARKVDFSLAGSGDVDARRLVAADAYVRVTGSGDASVHATESFDGETNGSGDVNVYGDPRQFDRDERGSGDIRRR
jgi:hypothetical protein